MYPTLTAPAEAFLLGRNPAPAVRRSRTCEQNWRRVQALWAHCSAFFHAAVGVIFWKCRIDLQAASEQSKMGADARWLHCLEAEKTARRREVESVAERRVANALTQALLTGPPNGDCSDWRRVATRYDKFARNFPAAAALVAVLYWVKS